MIFLLDTNIISDLMRHPQGQAAQRLTTVREHDVLTSIVVACEISFGLARKPSPRFVRAWAELREILPIAGLTDDVLTSYGEARRALEAAGTPIGPHDTLIAAHALSMGAVVVTDNVREFSRVPGLTAHNWLEPHEASP